jgi:signal transduction histidine kinase
LIEALSWQGSQFMKNTGIHFELELVEVPSQLPDHVATCIYRVMQEALNNVAKYSHASMVQMRIVKDNDELEVSLEDNGNGFEMAEALKKNSFGVVGMRERVFAIKGTFHIQTAPESGTKIVFRVPL